MEVSDIRVGGRARKNVGGLEPLKDSIKPVGLLYPIVVAPDAPLIAGYRRHEASERMGME